jgi:hypothetical protein
MIPRILRDPGLQSELAGRGYVVVRLLSAEEAASMVERLAALRPEGEFASTDESGKGFDYHASYLDSDKAYRDRADALVREAFAPRIGHVLDDYVILMGGFLVKPPGAGDVKLHMDWTMTADPDEVRLNVWCPLIHVDEGNGALRVVERSHKLVPHIGAPHTPSYCRASVDALKARSTPIRLQAGEAVIFDNSLLHWSPPNRSDKVRPVAGFTCVPAAATPAFYRLDREAGGRRFEVYDMSGGAWLAHKPADLFDGTISRPSLGFVANPNRALPLAEIERLLERGSATRRRAYGGPPSLLDRLKALVGLGG